jgi:hypothetical protein
MFKIQSDPKLSNPNAFQSEFWKRIPIRSEEFLNKINLSFKLKYLTK